jgi:Fe-Mn family superoxide dismutase
VTEYTLPKLRYEYNALEPHLSSEILELHHAKHHAAYVKGANEALAGLEEARRAGSFKYVGQLEKNLAFHLSGHVLHTLLWRSLSPAGGGAPRGGLAAAITRDFGSFDAFKAQLTAAAAAVQGSGWGALAWEPLGKRLIVEQVHDHQSDVGNGALPLIVVDMWEHAYYLQYQNRKNEWLEAFWELVDWNDADARFAKLQNVELGL